MHTFQKEAKHLMRSMRSMHRGFQNHDAHVHGHGHGHGIFIHLHFILLLHTICAFTPFLHQVFLVYLIAIITGRFTYIMS